MDGIARTKNLRAASRSPMGPELLKLYVFLWQIVDEYRVCAFPSVGAERVPVS